MRMFIFVYPLVLTPSKKVFQSYSYGIEHHRHLHPDQPAASNAMESRPLHGTNSSLNRRTQVPYSPLNKFALEAGKKLYKANICFFVVFLILISTIKSPPISLVWLYYTIFIIKKTMFPFSFFCLNYITPFCSCLMA